ncbi:hypothetical protein GQX73_g9327 [Xylaria multiplex]|uniref:YDG domain-containing protein n=1 Tax=Xylaria multiplex TaxID=323545 RepID=A0A7C8MN64_9PEZI|nr:hypothetical protein GQX73_g9327 [Xylaria multiplex]
MEVPAVSTAGSPANTNPDIHQIEDVTPSGIPAPDAIINVKANVAQIVRVLNMGGTESEKLEQMKKQGRSILTLCRNKRDRITPDRVEEMSKRFADATLYLDWLDTNVEMVPRINTSAKIELVLTTLTDRNNNVPEDLVSKASALLVKYRAENWGQDTVPDVPDVPEEDAVPNAEPTIGEIQLPPANDPVFGTGGIMCGIILDTSNGRKTYRLRVDIPRKSPKVYGHNDIALGSWYAFQINALFWGAHGARMAGIAGSVTTGAWSIVVASTYEDLDTDYGNTIYYSGSNSHDNKNPRQAAPASQGTKALHASITTQNPVRVLRSGGSASNRSQNRYLPSCGLRYDGLYRVASFRQRLNKNGGLYDQFKLERLPNQTPVDELRRSSPTTEQPELGVMAKYNKLAGKHIVVIGGSKGIGRGVVEAALESQARVTLAGSSQQSADAAVASIKAEYPGAEVRGVGCDLSRATVEEDLDALLTRAAELGGGEIDHIVYTAADSLTLGKLEDLTPDAALKAAHMRFLVPVMVGKMAKKHLRGAAEGRDKSLILTTGSIASKPSPGWSVIAYFAAGLKGLTRNLALDLSPIRVNAVEPGAVNTPLWDTAYKSVAEREAALHEMCKGLPVGRVAAVEDVAEAYVYLLRDTNATGETVQTRGGHHLV